MKMCISKAFNSNHRFKMEGQQKPNVFKHASTVWLGHPFQSLVEPFSKKPHPRMNGNSSQCRVHQ